MDEFIIEVLCDNADKHDRPPTVERFALVRDDDEPSGWRWIPGLRSMHDHARLDGDNERIKPVGIFGVLRPAARVTVTLRCKCGRGRRVRGERLAPVLIRTAQAGESCLSLSQIVC